MRQLHRPTERERSCLWMTDGRMYNFRPRPHPRCILPIRIIIRHETRPGAHLQGCLIKSSKFIIARGGLQDNLFSFLFFLRGAERPKISISRCFHVQYYLALNFDDTMLSLMLGGLLSVLKIVLGPPSHFPRFTRSFDIAPSINFDFNSDFFFTTSLFSPYLIKFLSSSSGTPS